MYYFISSLSWRSLYSDIMNFVSGDEITIEALESLIKAERILNEYLKRERTDIGNIEHPIFFFDRIKDGVGNVRAENQGMRSVVGNEFSYWMNQEEEQMNKQ